MGGIVLSAECGIAFLLRECERARRSILQFPETVIFGENPIEKACDE